METAAIAGLLQSRLGALREWNSDRARQLFVECALRSQLGDDLAQDPAFEEIVGRVSEHLASEPAVSSRLDHVLRNLVKVAT